MKHAIALSVVLLLAGVASADVVIFDSTTGLAAGWSMPQGFTVSTFDGKQVLAYTGGEWNWGELAYSGTAVDATGLNLLSYQSNAPADFKLEGHRLGTPGHGWDAPSFGFSHLVLLDGVQINRFGTAATANVWHSNTIDLGANYGTQWDGVKANVGAFLLQKDTAGVAYITDVKFMVVPEPATMGLLALGGLGLLRRRK